MKGILFCLIVIVAVTAVRSQGPPTRTKKGQRPSRRNDNTDVGLPSGADVPDGRRMNKAHPAAKPAAPAPAVTAVKSQVPPTRTRKGQRPSRRNDNPDFGLPSGADVPDGRRMYKVASAARPAAPAPARPIYKVAPAARPAAPAPARRMHKAPPAARPAGGRRNDNTDRGLPSGADFPDNRNRAPAAAPAPAPSRHVYTRPAQRPTKTKTGRRNDNPDWGLPSGRDYPDAGWAPAPAPVAAPAAPAPVVGGRRNDNPDWGLPSGRDFPDAGWAPAPAPAVVPVPAAPAHDCDYYCQFEPIKPVCTIYGNEYDNDCYRKCRNEPRECENICPCDAPAPAPAPAPDAGWAPAAAPAGPCDYCYAEEDSPVCIDNEEVLRNECFARCEGKTITCSSTCPC